MVIFLYFYWLLASHTIIKSYTLEVHHKKTDLKVFVVVIPNNSFLGMAPTIKYYSTAFIDYIL